VLETCNVSLHSADDSDEQIGENEGAQDNANIEEHHSVIIEAFRHSHLEADHRPREHSVPHLDVGARSVMIVVLPGVKLFNLRQILLALPLVGQRSEGACEASRAHQENEQVRPGFLEAHEDHVDGVADELNGAQDEQIARPQEERCPCDELPVPERQGFSRDLCLTRSEVIIFSCSITSGIMLRKLLDKRVSANYDDHERGDEAPDQLEVVGRSEPFLEECLLAHCEIGDQV